MKKLIIILTVFVVACYNRAENEFHKGRHSDEQEIRATALSLNNGNKWKADELTNRNVSALLQLLNDSIYADGAKRWELVVNIQSRVDTMIKQCTMKGPEHEALHKWLSLILNDMKKLKEDDSEYSHAREALKKDIENFYLYFE